MTPHLFITWFHKYFKPSIETYCSRKKKDVLQNITAFDDVSGYLRMLIKNPDNKISVGFMPANPTSFLQLTDQGAISTFKSYYLRNRFL